MKRRRAIRILALLILAATVFSACGGSAGTVTESETAPESEPAAESEPEKSYPPCPAGTADELVEKYYPGATPRFQNPAEGKDGRAEFLYDHAERQSPTRMREQLLTAICLFDEAEGIWKADRVYATTIGIIPEPTRSYSFRDFKINVPESWHETEWHMTSVGDVEVKWFLDEDEVMRFNFGQDFEDPEKTEPLHFDDLGMMADLFSCQTEGTHIRVILKNPLFQVGSLYPSFETDRMDLGEFVSVLGTLKFTALFPEEEEEKPVLQVGDTAEGEKVRFTLQHAELCERISLRKGDGYLLPTVPDDETALTAGEGETLLAFTFTAESIDHFKTWFIGARSGWRLQWKVEAGGETYPMTGQTKEAVGFEMRDALWSDDGGKTWQTMKGDSVELFSEKTVVIRSYGVIRADILKDSGEILLTVNVLDGDNAYTEYTYKIR